MTRTKRIREFAIAAFLSVTLALQTTSGQENASFFPTTTVLYLQIDHPDQLMGKIEQHPITTQVKELRQVKQAVRAPQFAIAMLVKALIEEKIEQPLLDAIKENTAGGVSIGIDSQTNGIALVFKAKDEKKLKQLAGTVLDVVANGAKQRGEDTPFEKTEYRDAVAAKFDDLIIARFKSWFVVSNKNELAKIIVDRMHDHPKEQLSQLEWFQDATSSAQKGDLSLAVHLDALREAGLAQELFSGQTDNPAAELIFGGLMDAFKNSPWISGNLSVDEGLSLTFSTPFQQAWATPAREFFFGGDFDGTAPAPIRPLKPVSSITSYRDIAGWWLSKEELFAENVIAQLAQADSQLSTIFSGMDFGQDVLGALEPGIEIVVAENQFDEAYLPDVKLPAFAIIGKLNDPAKIRRKLKIAFQSVIGFANINLGMQGQPQLDLETSTIGETKICAAEYYYEDETEEGLLLFNFSPTIAFQGDYLIVSSTKSLATELAESASQQTVANNASSPTNTRIEVDLQVLQAVLDANKEALITQNMLEEGNSRKEAEQAISLLLEIGDMLKEATLDLRVLPEAMKLDFELIPRASE